MQVSSLNGEYIDVACPICGYSRWTEEKMPTPKEVQLSKDRLNLMNMREKEKAVNLFYKRRTPLVSRLKNKP
jgi:hypothetical protein